MKRVSVIVDGLNHMHSLQHQDPHAEYLNLVTLANRLTNPNTEVLLQIQYFSATAAHVSDWGQEKQRRFIELLGRQGVKVVLGHFNQTRQTCENCGYKSKRHIEKQSDLLPAIKLVKAKFPAKEIKLVSTVAYLRPIHATMGRFCDGQIRLSPELVAPHLISYEDELA